MPSDPIEFSQFINHLQVGVYRSSLGVRAKFLYGNATFCQMLGCSSSEVTKLAINSIFADRRQYLAFHKTLRREKSIENFEAKLFTSGRKTFWCSLSATLTEGSKGKKYADVVVRDVSVRKQFEKELVESKEMFKTVFENTAAAITVLDKDERIVAWNPFAEQMFEMRKEDLFNKPVKELYPKKEWRRMRSFRIRKKGMLSDIETQVYRKDGSIIDVNLSISILKDVDGNIAGSIGIIRDITKQKQAERKIIESENKIRVILDNSPAAIMLTDDQERIVSWNKFAEKLMGMKRKDLYLKNVSALYPQQEWEKIRAENIRKTGSRQHLETKVVRKNGDLLDVDLSINILKDPDGNIIGSVGIMQDITEQKKLHEMLLESKMKAEEANQSKSLFLANMSHEVRTPMNTIMGMLDLTLDTPLQEEQKENLVVAKDAAVNLLGLLNDILDLSRVEAGKITLENIEFHLPNVAKSVCKGLSVIANAKELNLDLEVASDVPELIEGDPVRIRQVLINLINNAIKFTYKGTIKIKIALQSKKADKAMIEFSVADQGIGIPKDRQDKIFEVFTQADSSTTRQFGGTGLGLAICKRLTEMMGGRIWVDSKESIGSTFFFTGKFKIVDPSRAGAIDTESGEISDEATQELLKDLKIILAEDNLVNQKIAIRLLEKQGCSVVGVDNGQAVVDKLNKEHFDLVLMDAHMPILDGLEATEVIRKNEESTGKHVPIIALTARAMEEDRRKCLEVGMDGYVTKPIDRKKMFEEISHVLRKANV